MTIIDAIHQADELAKNAISLRQKITWLSRCESMVKHEVIDKYVGGEEIGFEEFREDTPLDTQLIMRQPYDEAYIHYLCAQIYYAYDEYDKYNASISMFNAAFDGFQSDWKGSHTPLFGRRFLF